MSQLVGGRVACRIVGRKPRFARTYIDGGTAGQVPVAVVGARLLVVLLGHARALEHGGERVPPRLGRLLDLHGIVLAVVVDRDAVPPPDAAFVLVGAIEPQHLGVAHRVRHRLLAAAAASADGAAAGGLPSGGRTLLLVLASRRAFQQLPFAPVAVVRQGHRLCERPAEDALVPGAREGVSVDHHEVPVRRGERCLRWWYLSQSAWHPNVLNDP